jgi:hypothetical protein
MNRTCGTCTMCCKLLGITELSKPRNEWCSHCDIGRGCKAYEDRPESCRAFECLWLQVDAIPEDERLDHTRVVAFFPSTNDSVQVHVDPSRPLAWNAGVTGKILTKLAESKPVLVTIGHDRKALGTKKVLRDLSVVIGDDLPSKK